MFDIGFLELVVILVLALLVLGPERLPKAAKTVGYWFGKARRYVEGMKAQVESEFDTTEVKRLLRNQEVQIRELQGKIQDTANVNQFIDDDDPGNGHQDMMDSDLDGSDQIEADLANTDLNESEDQPKPAGPQYEMIEEDDDRWDELEDRNPSTISAEENNEIDEKTDSVTDIESSVVETETSKTQSESVK